MKSWRWFDYCLFSIALILYPVILSFTVIERFFQLVSFSMFWTATRVLKLGSPALKNWCREFVHDSLNHARAQDVPLREQQEKDLM